MPKSVKELVELSKSIISKMDKVDDVVMKLDLLSAQVERMQGEEKEQAEKERLLQAGLTARLLRKHLPDQGKAMGEYPPARPQDYEKTIRDLERLNPELFPVWHQLFENFREDCANSHEDGFFSHWDHEYTRLFTAYVNIHARGRILDIGCGPAARQVYLSDFPIKSISGIDPLPANDAVEFDRARGFNEFLPWPDDSFDTAINATSLDHVLSLDLSLRETVRVLKPGGRFVVWISSVPDSPPFDPSKSPFEAIDRYHLFHFERGWIEPILKKYFYFNDITIIPQPGFDHVFYVLEPLGSRV